MDFYTRTWKTLACIFLFLNTVTLEATSPCNVSSPAVVNIVQGTVRGTSMDSLYGRQFYAFKGIPYAQPPLGELRFQTPRAPIPWSGTLNATNDPPPCMQLLDLDLNGAEDCLLLNVFTPQLSTSPDELLHVMVYIPGDKWTTGGARYYGPEYLMDRDIVLVVINYRVGPLGFLSTDDSEAPGNYGLKDQVQALRWVQDNIQAFRGNPNCVTIFGHSSGAACVHYHLLSPMSVGLFHRAIVQSGTAYSPQFRPSEAAATSARRLARLVGCPSENSTLLVSCLRAADPSLLVNMGASYHTPVVEYHPGEEEVFLPEHPSILIRDGRVSKVPLLLGTVSNEGSYWAAQIVENPEEIKKWNSKLDDYTSAPATFHLFGEKDCGRNLWEPMLNFYFGQRNHTLNINKTEALTQMYGDRNIYHPTYMMAVMLFLAGLRPIYIYNFDYQSVYHMHNFSDLFTPYAGVSHGDDLLFLFNYTYSPMSHNTTLDDMAISTITTLWANFAKHGDPTPQVQINEVMWEPVGASSMIYLSITKAEPSSGRVMDLRMSENLYKERMDFWKALPLQENKYLAQFVQLNFAPALCPVSYIMITLALFTILYQT